MCVKNEENLMKPKDSILLPLSNRIYQIITLNLFISLGFKYLEPFQIWNSITSFTVTKPNTKDFTEITVGLAPLMLTNKFSNDRSFNHWEFYL